MGNEDVDENLHDGNAMSMKSSDATDITASKENEANGVGPV